MLTESSDELVQVRLNLVPGGIGTLDMKMKRGIQNRSDVEAFVQTLNRYLEIITRPSQSPEKKKVVVCVDATMVQKYNPFIVPLIVKKTSIVLKEFDMSEHFCAITCIFSQLFLVRSANCVVKLIKKFSSQNGAVLDSIVFLHQKAE